VTAKLHSGDKERAAPEAAVSMYSPLGSLWHRVDLHFHTPSSFDYDDKSITNQQIIDCLVGHDLRMVAITDHHTMDMGAAIL